MCAGAAVEPCWAGWPVHFQVQFQIQMHDPQGSWAAQFHCHVQLGAPSRFQLQFQVQDPAACSSAVAGREVTWPSWLPSCAAAPQAQFQLEGGVSNSASAVWDSSRSQFHVQTHTVPGCWRWSPSTAIDRLVSIPLVVAEPVGPASAVFCCVTAPAPPSLPTLIETFVFWTPVCVAAAFVPLPPTCSPSRSPCWPG